MKSKIRRKLIPWGLLVVFLLLPSCVGSPLSALTPFKLDADTQGVMETVNNIVNTSIVSNDPNPYKAEYEAGFIQGRLQRDQIVAARDNSWDSAYLLNPAHSYPKQIPPSKDELALAEKTLKLNWDYTLAYMQGQSASEVGKNLRRLVYRLIGIYHGATQDQPRSLAFDDSWLPQFSAAELDLGYETPSLTFMDLYFINAYQDILYVLPDFASQVTGTIAESTAAIVGDRPGKCSAFVVRTADDIFLAHNNWNSFLAQSQALTLWINGDYLTANLGGPGYLCSDIDFGYSNKGILFNETTHRYARTEPKVKALWMFWRAALAEQFADSLDSFFAYISLELSGTYMNGYMVVDAKTKEIGLVEMSYKGFIFYKLNGHGGVSVSSKPEGLNLSYDERMVQPDYLLGINYPASYQIREDLWSEDNRPARLRQLLAMIGSVKEIESAKALITYTDPANPLSIYGRWDLGYGDTPAPKTIPDGAVDAKAISISMVQAAFQLKGVLDTSSPVKTFWMKFGTPVINGKPFIWSESPWKGWKLRSVPDRVDGIFTLLNAYIR
ncbi:MAG: hypothetical protein WCP58_06560 [bacterium]